VTPEKLKQQIDNYLDFEPVLNSIEVTPGKTLQISMLVILRQ